MVQKTDWSDAKCYQDCRSESSLQLPITNQADLKRGNQFQTTEMARVIRELRKLVKIQNVIRYGYIADRS